MDVMTYYSKLRELWDELDMYNEVETCTCGHATATIKARQREKMHFFSLGLNDSLSTVRSQIICRQPLPTIEEAYALGCAEENYDSQGPYDEVIDQNEDVFDNVAATQPTTNASTASNGFERNQRERRPPTWLNDYACVVGSVDLPTPNSINVLGHK
ncbi:hypothetical protein BUALT_Bualt01G0163700 [Buddleja alternifolia]|uniref:Uncharacterized protein n=1 Tax=Buddleja alternifolia TaxID=168488 RepID=A0AAV6Y7M7_9LAMI|nr:hypothetical protein BUALT_Bualt01G0163700 [Buddleja alternifolia]